MPAAAYLLMALEAARQLLATKTSDAKSLRLFDVILDQGLPFSAFPEPESAVETQLIARQIDGSNVFTFEIFSQIPAHGNAWTRHCFGRFKTDSVIEPSILGSHDQIHDQTLMNQAQISESCVGVGLSCLNLNPEGSSGKFKCNLHHVETIPIDLLTLNSILRLPPMSLLGRNLLTEYRLSSLTSISMPIEPQRSNGGLFEIRVKPSKFCTMESDIEICQSDSMISLKGLRYQAAKVIYQKPATNSLFFKPVLLPDITRVSATAAISFSRCAELLTHKWPMCEIKMNDVPERCALSILEAFGVLSGEKRSYIKSIRCSSVPPGVVSNRVQLIDGPDRTSKYHMVITENAYPTAQLSDQLHSEGFLCIPKAHIQDLRRNYNESLEVVCDITGLGPDPWILLRKAKSPDSGCADRRAVIFTDQRGSPSPIALERMEYVHLEPGAVAHFCKQSSIARFDAIIIDYAEKSVITTWTGSDLMPWLRFLLKSSDSILWVTSSRSDNPFANVAGSLLRTLQSEQPSLKISWLVIDGIGNKDPATFASQVEEAYVRMIEGENELVRRTAESGPEILRYLPDDDLSVHTGLSLPRKLRRPLDERDYVLDYAAPGEPVILSHNAHNARPTQPLSDDTIEVLVEASVVGTDNLPMFNSNDRSKVSRPHSGSFFAGKVLTSQDPELPPECCLVGWHPDDAHRKKMGVWAYNVCQYPSSMQPSQAASRYAAIAVASCVVDGAARARQAETFQLELQGPLSIVIKQICERLGGTVLHLHSYSVSKADFVVTFQRLKGICVNDRPINLASYLQSHHGRAFVQRNWRGMVDLPLQTDEYDIADYKEAFNNAKLPFSTVLLHRKAAKAVDHVPIYKKAAGMFTDHANYVVIGGLGGLGRFLCSWMIENGAKHITAISRSGAGTPEARNAVSAMNASSASVQCIKADACDRKAIAEILSKLRSEYPIKGIINLAMVLGDAPMATMTAEEWDRGLRVKIDSSWILHEETSQDHLDFFILFSSIASVLGNRSQGNYNVSNTYLNALAEYRQSLHLPGISVALGAMSKFSNALYLQLSATEAP